MAGRGCRRWRTPRLPATVGPATFVTQEVQEGGEGEQGEDSYYMVVAVTRAGLVPGVVRAVQVPAVNSTTVVLPAQVATTLSSNHPAMVMNTLEDVNKSEPGVDVGVEAASDGTARGVFAFGALTGVPRDAQVVDAHLDLSVQGTDLPGTLYDVDP